MAMVSPRALSDPMDWDQALSSLVASQCLRRTGKPLRRNMLWHVHPSSYDETRATVQVMSAAAEEFGGERCGDERPRPTPGYTEKL
jgi:hypothetical protein